MVHPFRDNINTGVPAVWCTGTVLNAAICGNPDDAVLRWDNTAVSGLPGIAVATNVANGTIVTITRAGIYACVLNYAASAGGTINNIGITMNTDAAGLVSDPALATVGLLAGSYANTLSPAATNVFTVVTGFAMVTGALAGAAGGALIRFHAADGANATPAAGDVTEADCQFSVTLISNLA